MYTWIDLNTILPGLSGLFFHTIDMEAERLTDILEKQNFKIIKLDGRRIINEETFFNEAKLAFEFPDYFGNNWAAWSDSLNDFGRSLPGNRVAVLWAFSDYTISRDLQVVIQAVLDLVNLAAFFALHSKDHQENNKELQQLEVFLLGNEEGFHKL